MSYHLNTERMGSDPSITIIGCGGTGGFVAEAICRLFTGREATIILMDHDRVEPHNLLRQNFQRQDVGKLKSTVMAERLSMTYDRTIGYSTETFRAGSHRENSSWNNLNTNLMIGCVDNAEARVQMNQYLRYNYGTWLIDAGNGRNWGQVLIGNRTKEQHQFEKSFQNDVCHWLPSPAMQRPDILTATPDTPPDIDCAAALDLLDQDPTINQMMAMLVVQVVRRMAANDCPWMSLYLDLEQGTMTPRYATPENVSQITKTPPEGLTGENKNDEDDDENSEEEYYEDEDEDDEED